MKTTWMYIFPRNLCFSQKLKIQMLILPHQKTLISRPQTLQPNLTYLLKTGIPQILQRILILTQKLKKKILLMTDSPPPLLLHSEEYTPMEDN